MCARFTLMMPWSEVVRILGGITAVKGKPSWNIAPTQQIAIIEETEDDRHLVGARWGLSVPWSTKPLINARAETAAQKPTFRKALQERRCLVPTTGFYEWRSEGGRKKPYFFRRPDEAPFVFAGILDFYKAEEGVAPACAILTTSASEFMRPFHDRMPVILGEASWDSWLDRSLTEVGGFADLLVPAPDDLLIAVPVSSRVNNPRNDDPSCVEPVGEKT